jgi:hypothetical protein
MRTITVLIGGAVVFVLLGALALASGNPRAASPTAAAAATAAPAAETGTLSPRGAVLGKTSQKVGDLTITLSAPKAAPVRGQNTVEALILNTSGQAVNDAKISFDLDMTNMSHGRNVVTAERIADGRYAANVTFMMPGPWRIISTVERGGKAIGSARFDFNVNMR